MKKMEKPTGSCSRRFGSVKILRCFGTRFCRCGASSFSGNLPEVSSRSAGPDRERGRRAGLRKEAETSYRELASRRRFLPGEEGDRPPARAGNANGTAISARTGRSGKGSGAGGSARTSSRGNLRTFRCAYDSFARLPFPDRFGA